MGRLRAANELKLGTSESWFGQPVTGEGEREVKGVRGREGAVS